MTSPRQSRSKSDQYPEPLVAETGGSALCISLIPLATVLSLFLLKIPFGASDLQFYRWSHIASLRLQRGLIPIIATAAFAAFLRYRKKPLALSNHAVFAITMLITFLLGMWTHLAPPTANTQHILNLLSPSHEGAFVTEASSIHSLDTYLQEFPERLQLTPEDLQGTRVLSNPPGVTMLAVAVDRILGSVDGLPSWIMRVHDIDVTAGSFEAVAFVRATCMAWVLTFIWMLSAPLLYLTFRLWWSPFPAAVLTIICFFTPSSICFVPGKDPAQLFTVSLIMWGWLSGFKKQQCIHPILGGVGLVIGLMSGLMHVWIAVVLVLGTTWSVHRNRDSVIQLLSRCVLPGAMGVIIGVAAAWLIWGWNLPAALLAVGQSYLRIQEGLEDLPWYWDVAKAPAFALFAGAGLWGLATKLSWHNDADSKSSLGKAFIVLSAAAIAYGCANTTFETPRLLVSFIPMLALGFSLCLRFSQVPTVAECRFLVSLTAVHVIATILQWCLFDVRESEMRIITGRYLF